MEGPCSARFAADAIGSVYEFASTKRGNAYTMARIVGSIAEAHYGGVPDTLARSVKERLSTDLRDVLDRYEARFPMPAR